MLTPAEELGLAGMNVASRVRGAFHKIDEIALAAMIEQIRLESLKNHVVYLRDGQPDAINVMACPLTVLPDQVAYIHYVTLTIHNALKRLVELYMQDFAVRDILRLPPEEEQWLWECWTPAHRENNPVFGRHDAVIDFTSPMWKDSLRFVEPNMGGIGGLHLVPSVERILERVVFPVLRSHDADLQLAIGPDIRELLMQEILEHLESVGRRAINVCFIDPKYSGSGIDEQEDVARYYHERYGLRVMHADPAELTQEGSEVLYNGQIIDLAYRDYAVCDLLELEKQGANIGPMRTLFSAEPGDVLDHGRPRPEKLLGSLYRPAVHAEVLQRRRAAGLPPSHPLDAVAGGAADAAPRRADRRLAAVCPSRARAAGS